MTMRWRIVLIVGFAVQVGSTRTSRTGGFPFPLPGFGVRSDPEAVFVYGTLRGDFCDAGDKYGVLRRTHASWIRASVRGYRLYQQSGHRYPFVVATSNSSDVIWGMLTTWPGGKEEQAHGHAAMDAIEGYHPDNEAKNTFFKRAVVQATPDPESVYTRLRVEAGSELRVLVEFSAHEVGAFDWWPDSLIPAGSTGSVQEVYENASAVVRFSDQDGKQHLVKDSDFKYLEVPHERDFRVQSSAPGAIVRALMYWQQKSAEELSTNTTTWFQSGEWDVSLGGHT